MIVDMSWHGPHLQPQSKFAYALKPDANCAGQSTVQDTCTWSRLAHRSKQPQGIPCGIEIN